MEENASITRWISLLRQGDEEAARQLWESFFKRLLAVANQKLKSSNRSDYDEEDIVLSAFKSFYAGVRLGRFPQLNDRHDLWRLLLVITSRKVADRFAFQYRSKRDTRRELAMDQWTPDADGMELFVSDEPTPALAAECAEQLGQLLDLLEHDDLKQLAVLKMEGFTNQEIAGHMSRSIATVERKLRTIREIWSMRVTHDE